MPELRCLDEWRREFSEYPMESGTCLVLHALSLFATKVGDIVYPSVAALSAHTKLSKPVVIKHLKKAQRMGWIGVRRFDDTGAKLRRNEYMIKSPEKDVPGWD